MKNSFSNRWKEGLSAVPVAELVGFRPVSFGEGKAVARATSTCQVLRGMAAKGR